MHTIASLLPDTETIAIRRKRHYDHEDFVTLSQLALRRSILEAERSKLHLDGTISSHVRSLWFDPLKKLVAISGYGESINQPGLTIEEKIDIEKILNALADSGCQPTLNDHLLQCLGDILTKYKGALDTMPEQEPRSRDPDGISRTWNDALQAIQLANAQVIE